MAYNFTVLNTRLIGTDGTGGSNGTYYYPPQYPGQNGDFGTNGTIGGYANGAFSNLTVPLDNAPSAITPSAVGGNGGSGGNGSDGNLATFVHQGSGNDSGYYTGTGGNGGAGGGGAAAGDALSSISASTFGSLGGANPNGLDLIMSATGGNGGAGGWGGNAGSGGITYSVLDPTPELSTFTTTVAAGTASNGGVGNNGGRATASLLQVATHVNDANGNGRVFVTANGGHGGFGGHGGSGAIGVDENGIAGSGGAAGDGGSATASVVGSSFLQTGSNLGGFTFLVTATAGYGSVGGAGGYGGSKYVVVGDQGGANPYLNTTITDGAGGAGGAGGDGGNAIATFRENTIELENGPVDIHLAAARGQGQSGGLGGIAGHTTTTHGTLVNGVVYTGVETAGTTGANGAFGSDGSASLELTNNSVTMHGAAQTLTLGLNAGPTYYRSSSIDPNATVTTDATVLNGAANGNLAFSGNTFTDSAGDGRLDLREIVDAAITVNIKAGTLSIGGTTGATISGYSNFTTALYNGGQQTVFVDGSGSQTYDLTVGTFSPPAYTVPAIPNVANRVIFTKGHGNDTIQDLKVGSVVSTVELDGFGASLDSFAEVQANATVVYSVYNVPTTVIATPDGGSISLVAMNVADLTADMFAFGGVKVGALGNDFVGNGVSDIIWKNSSNGDTWSWLMNGNQHMGNVHIGNLSGWTDIGSANFNGNGVDGVLWQNQANGQVYEWSFQGGQHEAGADVFLGTLPGWTASAGAFDGAGTAGVVWRNTQSGDTWKWTIANGQHVAGSDIHLGNTSGYSEVGTGDFAGNGTADLLWQNTSTGDLWEWRMAGGQHSLDVHLGNVAGYTMVGAGDFNGDGTTDLLWKSNSTGALWEWQMDSSGKNANSLYLGDLSGYNVASVGDFNGGGTAGVVWQGSAGDTWLWTMNGGQHTGNSFLGSTSGYLGH